MFVQSIFLVSFTFVILMLSFFPFIFIKYISCDLTCETFSYVVSSWNVFDLLVTFIQKFATYVRGKSKIFHGSQQQSCFLTFLLMLCFLELSLIFYSIPFRNLKRMHAKNSKCPLNHNRVVFIKSRSVRHDVRVLWKWPSGERQPEAGQNTRGNLKYSISFFIPLEFYWH